MLLKSFKKNIFRAECNPSFDSVHCIAHLDQDVSAVLPYLNTILGGFSYVTEPPSVTFKIHGRLITVHGDRIAVNALKGEEEADKILDWLKREINDAWENRENIVPSYENAPRPKLMEILKLLPRKAGCGRCGQPTCLVFAQLTVEGIKSPDDCPAMPESKKEKLRIYLSEFTFDF